MNEFWLNSRKKRGIANFDTFLLNSCLTLSKAILFGGGAVRVKWQIRRLISQSLSWSPVSWHACPFVCIRRYACTMRLEALCSSLPIYQSLLSLSACLLLRTQHAPFLHNWCKNGKKNKNTCPLSGQTEGRETIYFLLVHPLVRVWELPDICREPEPISQWEVCVRVYVCVCIRGAEGRGVTQLPAFLQ